MSVPPPRSASALATPNFLLFWLAQAISKFGDPITVVALAAITYRLTGSALYTTAALLVATVPQATFGFFAGAIADDLNTAAALGLSQSRHVALYKPKTKRDSAAGTPPVQRDSHPGPVSSPYVVFVGRSWNM